MNLPSSLRDAGIEWCIDFVCEDIPSQRNPGTVHKAPRIRIRLTDMPKAAAGGESPVTHEMLLYPGDSHSSVADLLAWAMRKFMPNHEVFNRWQVSKGVVPIKVDTTMLGESLSECIHVALRKCVDGEQSCIQWNAIHHLANADWQQFLTMARAEIEKLLVAEKTGEQPSITQYDVGMALKKAFVGRADEVTYRLAPDNRKPVVRNDLEKFALMSFIMANKLTADTDFVFGWASYLCKALPRSKKDAVDAVANS